MNGTHDDLSEWTVSEAGGLQSCVRVLQRLQGCRLSLRRAGLVRQSCYIIPSCVAAAGKGVQLRQAFLAQILLNGCHHRSASFGPLQRLMHV